MLLNSLIPTQNIKWSKVCHAIMHLAKAKCLQIQWIKWIFYHLRVKIG